MQQPPFDQPQWGQPGQYPQQQPMQPPQPPRKSRKGLWIILAIVAFVLIFGCIGVVAIASQATNTNTGTNTGAAPTSGSTSTPTAAPASHFKVGQVVKVGDTWQVTVLSAKLNTGSEFSKPGNGNIYLVIDVSLKNISSMEQMIYGGVQFTTADSTGQKYDETFTDFSKPAPNGKVEAGSLTRGELIYEVPKSQHSFTLAFEASLVESGQTIWDISV